MEEDDLKNFLTNKQFVRYQQFFLLASLRNDPTVRWCPKYGLAAPPHQKHCCVDALAHSFRFWFSSGLAVRRQRMAQKKIAT